MSKQLSLSATFAVISMSLFALATVMSGAGVSTHMQETASVPLVGYEVTR